MFVVCPITFDLIDANWYESIEDAKEDAFQWSVELNGESVQVYEAIPENRAYTLKPLCLIEA